MKLVLYSQWTIVVVYLITTLARELLTLRYYCASKFVSAKMGIRAIGFLGSWFPVISVILLLRRQPCPSSISGIPVSSE